MQTREEEVIWVNLRKRFLEKYFSNNTRHECESEFLTLQYRNMTIQAYVE